MTAPVPYELSPADLDELVDWFERFSHDLVLLGGPPLPAVRQAVASVREGIGHHLDQGPGVPLPRGNASRGDESLRAVVASDHEWFRTSLEQLGWFLAVVEGEDHGGHRQALGQYGRLLAESFRRHRRVEEALQPIGTSGRGSISPEQI